MDNGGTGAGVIVVLGARLTPGGTAGAALERRLRHGAALFRAGRGARMLVTGGPAGASVREADVMAGLLVALGVPAAVILREDQARDTWENARFCAPLVRGQGPVVIVTDRYHLPRAWLAFRLAGVRGTASGAPWGDAPRVWRRLGAVAREGLALPVLVLRAGIWRLRGRP